MFVQKKSFRIDDWNKLDSPNDIILFDQKKEKNVKKTFKSHRMGWVVYHWHRRKSNTILGYFNEADVAI